MDKQELEISDKELMNVRKQEMESMLPGLVAKLTLPRSGKQVDVYSKEISKFSNKEEY